MIYPLIPVMPCLVIISQQVKIADMNPPQPGIFGGCLAAKGMGAGGGREIV
jgi:hypothetical protein